MGNIRVSYIITTFNRAPFLERTLKNVSEFVTSDDELIIIDAGSTDPTMEVIEKYRHKVSLFKSEPDHGEAHGFNKGILESKGKYIKILTDDDYYYPESMMYAISVMDQEPEVDALLCGGEGYEINEKDQEPQLVSYHHLPHPDYSVDEINRAIFRVFAGLGLILRRNVIARVGLFDPSFHAVDSDYIFRLINSGVNFKYLDIKLYRHIAHRGSGHKKIELSQRDGLKVLMRSGMWNDVVTYPPQALAKILGLDHMRGGLELVRMILDADRLRRKLFPAFIVLAWITHWLLEIVRIGPK
ncbi:MAG: glycosyltransferase, partial [Acidobacteriota bacterium]|nr:glycosyltransferase [Acidobacteriota bacterium]